MRKLMTRRSLGRMAAAVAMAALAACAPTVNTGGGTTPAATGGTVRVALLVPAGSAQATDNLIAQNLENAARLAISDLGTSRIDLRVYPTGGSATQAATVARAAVSDGAQIILGPVYAEEANAAGVAVASSGVNVLAFSNNPTIAGNNVFILGQTFRDTANRLVGYSSSQGINSYVIAHANDLGGNLGRDAISAAITAGGGTVAGVESYALSQAATAEGARRVGATVNATGAQAVITTASVNADLPILATVLPEAGVSRETTRLIGLTRWNATSQALTLPGLQGGIFTLPDQARVTAFEGRYSATYGQPPHPLASLAYDGIAAVGALLQRGGSNPLSRGALTQTQGFEGTSGIFRFLPDGTTQRGLAVAEIRNNMVSILDPAPRSFGGPQS
ncbi:extracellular ligand-binding receptor [Ketogulonicigenium vulgare Y25]|nr:penicillin-binding protein activator [Ketogulonicigenium vulgare]ADO41422.1 extracellular ligand-binding receptor [Ketogulonicigenium vulgare Y25]ALJ80038.1 ABC transporter substrate-binding protein [Ketogulonicigenium vulgare]ANW32920.1 ABC transporter substrate-binding protein [Ketogulonicigenium vulgare]AOZ53507.1 extracellular ligand-binding receptor [Ketogulonicigenium vulgare]